MHNYKIMCLPYTLITVTIATIFQPQTGFTTLDVVAIVTYTKIQWTLVC